jgi:alpha-L-fucosidase
MDYKKITDLIREVQPDAVVYDSGTMVKYLPDRCLAWPRSHGSVHADQDYRRMVDGQLRWYPNEPSLILQGNWFHNLKPMVGLDRVKDYYLKTVGHGVTPLMNVSPNRDGLIDEPSVERLKEFKAWVDRLHNRDPARSKGVRATADSIRGDETQYGPEKAIDGEYATYYATDDGVTNATLVLDLGQVREIDGFILQEYIPLGQRVDGYSLECRVDGEWREVFSGKKIGYKRIILEGWASAKDKAFPATDRVRLKINQALACPLISTFQVIAAPDTGGDAKPEAGPS